MKRKSLIFLLIFSMCAGSFAGLYQVKAFNEQVIASYTAGYDSGVDQSITADTWNSSSPAGLSYSFVPTASGLVTKASLLVARVDAYLHGPMKVSIFEGTGIIGTNMVPTGDPLCVSDSFDASSLPPTPGAWYNVTFSTGAYLTSGQEYCITLRADDIGHGAINGTGHIHWYARVNTIGWNMAMFRNRIWDNAITMELLFAVYGDTDYVLSNDTITTYHQITRISNIPTVGPSGVPLYGFTNIILNYNFTQNLYYNFHGEVLNGTTPVLYNGTYSVFNSATYSRVTLGYTDAYNAAAADYAASNWTEIENGTVTNGIFNWPFYALGEVGSTDIYYVLHVEANLTGLGLYNYTYIITSTAMPDIVVMKFSGDYFLNSDIFERPTETKLKQGVTGYRFNGYVYMNWILNGTGNFTVSSTGVSPSETIIAFGTYSQTAFGTFSNGTFTFGLAPRSASSLVWEGLKVEVQLDNGFSDTFMYFFGWYRPGDSSGGIIPYPAVTPQPIASAGVVDSVGFGNFLNVFVSFMLLFILVGTPALILGAKAGMPGLIIGATIGLGLGVMAGLLAWWFIFLIASGVAVGFMMWRRNDGQG